MIKPTRYPIKKLIRFDEETIAAIDDWRRSQTPIPNQTDAIRSIIVKWLEQRGENDDRR